LPLNFSVEQKDVDPSATEITVVMYYVAGGMFNREAVTFRKMPIK